MVAKGRPSKADSTWEIFPFLVPLGDKSGGGNRGFGLQLEEDRGVVPFRNDLLHIQPHRDL
jgi:hypothetical protein